MPSLQIANVAFASFPHEDSSKKSERPCLVLAVDVTNNRFYAAKITTTPLHKVWAFSLKNGTQDTCDGSIRFPSWVNLRRRAWIPFDDCTRVFGTLKAETFEAIRNKIEELFAPLD